MAVAQPLRLALAQIDPTVGDIDGNAALIREQIARAREERAQLVLFPELAVTGYPPEDLLLKPHFLEAGRRAVEAIAADVRDMVALVGFAERAEDVYNGLAVLAGGKLQAVYRKVFLPNYGVFDEQRYFQAGPGPALIEIDGLLVGLTICEDIWEPGPPATAEALAGATLIVNASASPYHRGKGAQRERMIAQRARDTLAVFAFCNLVGGQDELVFDGHSLVVDERGETIARGPQFAEQLVVCDVDPSAAAAARLRDARQRPAARAARPEAPVIARLSARPRHSATQVGGPLAKPMDLEQEVYAALVTGLRDYVAKNGFERVVVGVSGGIDSALVALIAVDALGAERVSCAVMPSPHSSPETQADARRIAANLGAEAIELPIEPAMAAYRQVLAGAFAGTEPGIAEENVQARIRGNLLMALSNKFGWLVLTTGNKSELSVGYSTLYGDLAGGFAVIKDVFKTWVYRLVRWRSERSAGEPVPAGVLERAPSAELRPGQTDQDSLPPYDLLDEILEAYVEEDQGAAQMAGRGLPAEVVADVIRRVDLAEYKRRQAPPGIKVSEKAFGRDRRLPITNRFGDGRRGPAGEIPPLRRPAAPAGSGRDDIGGARPAAPTLPAAEAAGVGATETAPVAPPPARVPRPRGRGWRSLPRRQVAVLAGLVSAALIAAATVLLVAGGGEQGTEEPGASSTAPPGTDTTAQSFTRVTMRPVGGGSGAGVALFGIQAGKPVLAVEARDLEPTPPGKTHVIWLYNSRREAYPLARKEVGVDGRMSGTATIPRAILPVLDRFRYVDVSLEDSAEKRPVHGGPSVLRGRIPAGASPAAASPGS